MNKKATTRTAAQRAAALDAERRQMLQDRKREIQTAVQGRIQSARAEAPGQTVDASDGVGVDVQEDIAFALIQNQAAVIRRIDEALKQIDAGKYGLCVECHGNIAANRLRALPFAVRCTACEDAIERRDERTRRLADKVDPFSDAPAGQ